MHAHFPHALLTGGSHRKGVVEVLGVVGVDGEGEHIAEILAPRYFGFADAVADVFGLALHVLGIFVWQVIFGQYGMHLGIVFALVPQHIDHFAHRVALFLGPIDDAHHSLVARPSALEAGYGHEDVAGQRAVLGEQEGVVVAHLQFAHKGVLCPFYNLHHLCLGRMPAAAGQQGGLHAVAVEGVHGVAFHHQDGFFLAVGDETVAAVALAHEDALHGLTALVEPVAAPALVAHEVVGHHVVQHVGTEQFQRMRLQFQCFRYVLQRIFTARMGGEEGFQLFCDALLVAAYH